MFDLMRLLFATFVLLAHAPELLDGNRSREPLTWLAHTPLSLGGLGVFGFFLLSGFLMVQSWQADPHVLNFLRKRVLRVVPGYLVAASLSVAVLGWLAPGVPHFFSAMRWSHLLTSMLLLGPPATPLVTPGEPSAIVNGAMWSIAYEFRCYLIIALLGVLTILRRPAALLALTFGLIVLSVQSQWLTHTWTGTVPTRLLGEPRSAIWLLAVYLLGVLYHVFRDRIPFHPALALLAIAGLLLVARFSPAHFEHGAILLGGYLLFYLGRLRFAWVDHLHRLPDISYGVYLYGWPVETLLIFFGVHSPVAVFLIALLVCYPLGWLSWHFVERPMLRWKRRPSAPLPAP